MESSSSENADSFIHLVDQHLCKIFAKPLQHLTIRSLTKSYHGDTLFERDRRVDRLRESLG